MMYVYPICLRCLKIVYPPGGTLTIDSRELCMCPRPLKAEITLKTTSGTSTSTGWLMVEQPAPKREPVPSVFSEAFKDGELEL